MTNMGYFFLDLDHRKSHLAEQIQEREGLQEETGLSKLIFEVHGFSQVPEVGERS